MPVEESLQQKVERVYITRSTLRVIREEALDRYGNGENENETGGILVGRRIDSSTLLILAATDPGVRATRRQVEFEPDVEYANQLLAEFCEIYNNADYIGTWHKHPLRYPRFSIGDVQTAHAFFADKDYSHIDETLNPIVWVDGDHITTRYYYMNRVMAQSGQVFLEIPASAIEEIEDDDVLVVGERNDPEGAFRLRLSEERRLLVRDGYKVTVRSQPPTFFFLVRDPERLPDTTIYLSLSADFANQTHYPKQSPEVIVEQHNLEKTPLRADEITHIWANKDHEPYLVDVVRAVTDRLLNPAKSVSPLDVYSSNKTTPLVEQHPRHPFFSRYNLLVSIIIIIIVGSVSMFVWSRGGQVALSPTIQTSSPIAATVVAIGKTSSPLTTSALIPNTPPPTLLATSITASASMNTGTSPTQMTLEQILKEVQVLSDLGQYEKARSLLHNRQGNINEQQTIANVLADTYLAEGKTTLNNAQFDAAEKAYNQVATITPVPQGSRRESATAGLDNVKQRRRDAQTIAAELKTFETALAKSPPDGDSARTSLDTIQKIMQRAQNGWLFPSPIFDQRVNTLFDQYANSWLIQARDSQLRGSLDSAAEQYQNALNVVNISPDIQKQAQIGHGNLQQAVKLWNSANNARVTNRFATERNTLNQLSTLDGFGASAQNPQGGKTVSDLLGEVAQRERTAQTAVAFAARQTQVAAQAFVAATQTAAALTTITAVPSTNTVSTPVPLTPEISPTPTIQTDTTATSVAPTTTPTEVAVPTVYKVDISEITADRMRIYLNLTPEQPIPSGTNAFVDNLNGLKMQLVYKAQKPVAIPVAPFGIDLNRQVRILVVSDASGQVTTLGNNVVTPEAGKYYLVTVSRV